MQEILQYGLRQNGKETVKNPRKRAFGDFSCLTEGFYA